MILLLGDVHGNFEDLKSSILRSDLRDSTIICVGDFGVRFVLDHVLLDLNTFLSERNLCIMTIRGNHDDPSYFDGSHDYSNLLFLPDYTLLSIEGQSFLFIGGAHSVDRKAPHRVQGKSWWKGEPFNLNKRLLPKHEIDVLVTHSASPTIVKRLRSLINLNDVAKHYGDFNLVADCKKEQEDIDFVLQKCRPKYHYCGHFHESVVVHLNNIKGDKTCVQRCLDIQEIREFPLS